MPSVRKPLHPRCDPTGKPHAPLLTRGLLRAVFLMLGTILVVCSVWLLIKG